MQGQHVAHKASVSYPGSLPFLVQDSSNSLSAGCHNPDLFAGLGARVGAYSFEC